MNKTRIVLLLYPPLAMASLTCTNAFMSEHEQVWRARDWRDASIMALAFWTILGLLLRRAKRDRWVDLALASVGALIYAVPFAGVVFSTALGIWLSWDLRKPQ